MRTKLVQPDRSGAAAFDVEVRAMSQVVSESRSSYSVTSLMVYEACPRQYYVTFVQGIPPLRTPAMARGTSLHKLIADHLTQPGLFPPAIPPDVLPLYERFTASRFNMPPVESERPFVLPFDRGDVRGRVDLVLPGAGGTLEIVDFKSGLGRGRDDIRRSLQLPIYARAVAARRGIDLSRLRLTYYFLGDGEEISLSAQSASSPDLETRVNGILEAIQRGRFTPRPACRCEACRRASRLRRRRR
jgi:hypothetical protein